MTQSNLAVDLHTESGGGTPWPGYWKSTLESWTQAGWTIKSGPGETYLWDSTCCDVDNGWPLIYDTHMNSTNGYLVGYPSGEVFHYVTGDGYGTDERDYKWIHYVDPNRYRSEAFGPHWLALNDMWRVVRDRGIAW